MLMRRRAIIAAFLASSLLACEPVSPPVLAMRFEVTQESLSAIETALRGYAARERYKFDVYQGDVDRHFALSNEYVRITMGAGAWNEAAYITHEWPFEYQVHFYTADTSVDVNTLAVEIGALLSAIPGVRKSGPNFVPDKIVPEAAQEATP